MFDDDIKKMKMTMMLTFLPHFSAHGRLKAGQMSSLRSVAAVCDWERPAPHDDGDFHDDADDHDDHDDHDDDDGFHDDHDDDDDHDDHDDDDDFHHDHDDDGDK